MKRWTLLRLGCAALALVAGGCGNDGGLATGSADAATPPDLAAAADLAMPDLAMPDLVPSLGIGMACPSGNECGASQICLSARASPMLPAGGYCTKTCMNDADCGGGAFCGPALPGVGQLCWATCDANNACAGPDRVCGRRLDGVLDLVRPACYPGNPAARDGSPCKTFGDCNRNQVCANNPFEDPNGSCFTVGCTPGDNTTCSPAQGNNALCLPIGNLALCVARCKTGDDCRAADKYSCTPINPMGMGPSVCVFAHQPPGSACAADAQCGQPPWRCLTGAAFPGGYCGAAAGTCDPKGNAGCPDNSLCYDPTPGMPNNGDQFCARLCQSDNDCRGKEGYQCKPVGANQNGCRLP